LQRTTVEDWDCLRTLGDELIDMIDEAIDKAGA